MKTAGSEQHTQHHIGAWFSHAARLGVAAVAMGVLLCTVAAGAAQAQSVKNIVLVHGAFADGSSWAKVIPLLQAKGYNVTAVQNPLTSFVEDVAATKRALAYATTHSLPETLALEADLQDGVSALGF